MEGQKTILTADKVDDLIKQHEEQIERLKASKGVDITDYKPEINPDGSSIDGSFTNEQRAAEEKRQYFKSVVATIERERQRIAATHTVHLGDSRINERTACLRIDAVLEELSNKYSKLI